MVYIAFIFALALACLAGVQFVYLMFIESANRELRRRVASLESKNRQIATNVQELEREKARLLDSRGDIDERWPEFIDDPSHR
jgi:cell division protein FtsB